MMENVFYPPLEIYLQTRSKIKTTMDKEAFDSYNGNQFINVPVKIPDSDIYETATLTGATWYLDEPDLMYLSFTLS